MATPLVLIVDDEPMVREVLARYLEKEGFRVFTAQDGEEAVRTFEDIMLTADGEETDCLVGWSWVPTIM